MRAEYREEPCRSAISHVEGMPFRWSLNPYTGCAHQCTFCYVRAFELRAGRPSDDRYGASIRVKTNLLEVLQRQLARKSWPREQVAIGTATDPYQPAEGRYRLTRGSISLLADSRTPFSVITRGPLIVRDIDVLGAAARRVEVGVTFSVPTLDERIWRTTEPHTAPPRQRLEALRRLARAGISCSVGMAPILPGLSDDGEADKAGHHGIRRDLLRGDGAIARLHLSQHVARRRRRIAHHRFDQRLRRRNNGKPVGPAVLLEDLVGCDEVRGNFLAPAREVAHGNRIHRSKAFAMLSAAFSAIACTSGAVPVSAAAAVSPSG